MTVGIASDKLDMLKAIERIQHAVEMAERARNPSYCDQFKKAIVFSAHVD